MSFSLSRRGLIAASLSPLVAPDVAASTAPDATVAACGAWLRLDAQADDLCRAWSREEGRLAGACGWYQMSEGQRNAAPEGRCLAALHAQRHAVWSQADALLAKLPSLPAANLSAATALLVVAETLLGQEGLQTIERRLVTAAISGLRAIRDPKPAP